MSTSENEAQREDAKGSSEADTNTGTTSSQTIGNVENNCSRSSNQIDEKETPESSVQVRRKSEVEQSESAKNIEVEMEIAEYETEIVEHQSLDRIPIDSYRNLPSSNENDQEMNEGVSFFQISEDNSQIKSFDIESTAHSEAVLKRKMVTKSIKSDETYQKRTRTSESEEDSESATVPDTLESRPTQNIPSFFIEEVATSSTRMEFTCNVEGSGLQPCSDSDASSEDYKERLVEIDSDDDENPSASGVVKTELFVPGIDMRDILLVESVSNPCLSKSSTDTSLKSLDRDSVIHSSSMSTLDMYEPDMDDSMISNVNTVSTTLSNSNSESTSGVHSGESLHSSVSEINSSLSTHVDAVNSAETEKISEENTAETEKISEENTAATEKITEKNTAETETISEENTAETEKISEENTAEVDKQCLLSDRSSCTQNVQEILENKSTDQYDVCTQHDKSSLPEKQENDAEVAAEITGSLETMSALGPRDASPCDDSNMSLSVYSEHSSEYDHSSSTTASNTDEMPSLSQHAMKKGKTALSSLYAYTKGKKNVAKESPAHQMEGTSAVRVPDVEIEEVQSSPNLVISADSTVSTDRAEEEPPYSGNNDDNVIGEVQNECYSLYSGNERGQELSPGDRYYKHWKLFADKQWNKGEKFNEAFARAIRNYEKKNAERPTDGEAVAAGADTERVACVPSSVASDSETGASEEQDVEAADLSDSSSSVGDCSSPPRDARLLPLYAKMDESKGQGVAGDFDPYAELSEIVSVPDDRPFRGRDFVKMGQMLDACLSSREQGSSSSEESPDHD